MGVADEIAQLREGDMLDYDMQTWEITAYDTYSDAGWPADVWTLKSGTDVLFLEHEYDDGDVFRLSKPAKLSEILVEDYHGKQDEPFLTAIREDDAPSQILYQDEEYVLAEEDARVDQPQVPTTDTDELTRSNDDSVMLGVCGGIAQQTEMSSSFVRIMFIATLFGVNFIFPCLLMPVVFGVYFLLGVIMPAGASVSTELDQNGLQHYWVYQKGEEFVALECHGSNDWDAYVGREVDPYEFDNLLPGGSSD